MPSFSIMDLIRSDTSSASDAHQKAKNDSRSTGEAVGQVRRERRRSKEQSKELIKEFMAKQKEAVLFLDICDHLGRRPSPMLRDLVNEMVESGDLVREFDFGAGPLIARHLYRANR